MSDHRESTENPNEVRLSKRALLAMSAGACMVPIASLFAQHAATPKANTVLPREPLPKLSAENVDTVLNQRLSGANFCTVATQMVEGPYFIDNRIFRADIRDGQPGEKVILKLQVLDANSLCDPVKGALVSLWQANVDGKYSGYPNVNPDLLQPAGAVRMRGHSPETGDERWLRGVQASADDGTVTFTTIVPGWYTMRAPHIHVRVLVNERETATTQLFFPQSYINNLYSRPPYVRRGPGIITNENDIIRRQANAAAWTTLQLSEDAGGVIGVARIGLAHQ